MQPKPRLAIPTLLLVATGLLLALGGPGLGRAQSHSPIPSPRLDLPLKAGAAQDTVYLAGGCFWGIQAVYQHVTGVISATSGYSGGKIVAPTYEQVSAGETGHAEAVRVVFDPSVVTIGTLLKVFFSVAHDPTQLNQQGPDVGTQYRSAFFFRNDEQKKLVTEYVAQLTKEKSFADPIVTEVTQYQKFYAAEEYHQDYATLHPDSPYIIFNDAPKLVELKKLFPKLWTDKKAGS